MLKQQPLLKRFSTQFTRDRFEGKIDKLPDPAACWLWDGAVRSGYGAVKVERVLVLAHRIAYVIATGRDIPEGMVIDHLCGNKLCCNAAHLECVTQTENMARYFASAKFQESYPEVTACPKGHPKQRGRQCPTCNRDGVAAWKARHPERWQSIQARYEAKRP